MGVFVFFYLINTTYVPTMDLFMVYINNLSAYKK